MVRKFYFKERKCYFKAYKTEIWSYVEFYTQTLGSCDETWKLVGNIKIRQHKKKSDRNDKKSKILQLRGNIKKLGLTTFGMIVRVFANSPGDLGSIPSQVMPKTQKMVLDVSLLNTQHYKVRVKGKVEQSRERSIALPYTSV